MPALPNVSQVLKFILYWKVEADTLAITRHYLNYTGGPPSGANCAAMAASAVSEAETNWQTLVNTDVTLESAECTDLSSSTSGQGSGGTAWTGTRTGSITPPAAAVVLSHTIARRYRGGHPRSYMPFGSASDVTNNGLWQTSLTNACTTGFNNWVTGMIASGAGCTILGLVNVSYYTGFTVVTSPTTGRSRNVPKQRAVPLVDAVSASVARVQIGSQRRRNRDA